LKLTLIFNSNIQAAMKRRRLALLGLSMGVLAGACDADPPAMMSSPGTQLFGVNDPVDVPIAGLSAEDQAAFVNGDNLFDLPLRDGDGLGPLYTRTSCSSCHQDAERGPGSVQKMVVVEADGWTRAADQSKLPFGFTEHPLLTAGATTPIVPPAGDTTVKVTSRLGPPVLGRGYMEAVLDSEIERMAAEEAARPDAIHGRVNHVVYASQPNPDTRFHTHQPGDMVIGRFGVKARIATLDDFTADALQGDMGITSPLRPTEFANPDGLTDDLHPGVDITADSVNGRSQYVRTIAIPRRVQGDPRGPQLFDQVQCSACHVPSLRTRPDYPIAQLADIDAPIYSDLLLHDMGIERADGMAEGEATSRDFRTAPLIGLRFNKQYLRDGSAATIEDAILAHGATGSEAAGSVAAFQALSAADRALLVQFVSSL
jgi:CxxC motif-containing protein (DUF1111 family)